MTMLTISPQGRVKLGNEMLDHLGVKPGDKVKFSLLPDGSLTLVGARPRRRVEEIVGCLAPYTSVKASLEEIEAAIRDQETQTR